jgi:nucleoside-diphosphate-sugar epimerase
MAGSAFVLGATGQTGYAAVRALARSGWRVRTGARRLPASDRHWGAGLDVPAHAFDRNDTAALAAAVGDGGDVLVDCVAFHAGHARQLLDLGDRFGSVVVVSSVAVYADTTGRNFYADDRHWPDLPLNLTESQPTIAPSERSYGARKAALERVLLDAGRFPVTVLRPGAVYGRHSHYPREWYFAKRALDRRPYRILAHGGRSRFHPISASNLGELIRLAADQPGTRILNAGDPRAPSASEIGATIFAALDHQAEEILIEGPPPIASIGDTPWSVPRSVVLDTSAAQRELGHRALEEYADGVTDALEWMVEATRHEDWEDVFAYFYANQGDEAFDYAAEDRWVAANRSGR